jgi:predicted acetyltransferase
MGQWFGGQSVPTGGIAAVGVAPEHRGTGVAVELMRRTVQELRANGIPLSTLYASTSRLYRKVGYEQAGNACRFSLPTLSLTLGDRLLIRPLDLAEPGPFQDLYRQRAQMTNGNLDRNAAIWKRVLQPPEEIIHAYGIGPDPQPAGYVVFDQKPGAKGYNLQVRDLVILTPAAGRTLWTFFADHRSLASEITWKGPAVEPLLALLSEQTYQVVHLERWLMRIVDVPNALALRGYPAGIDTELHLEVQDDLLLENNGRFILAVSQGQGKVTPGGQGDLKLHVRGLAPLYSGLLTPQQLQAIGQLEFQKNG